MFSYSDMKEVLDRNWTLQEARTQIDLLNMGYQIDNKRPALEWQQHLDDASILPYLGNV